MGQLPKKTKMAREATMMAECHNEYYFEKSVSKKRDGCYWYEFWKKNKITKS